MNNRLNILPLARLSLVATLLLTGLAGHPARAADISTTTVVYGDLNLRSKAGVDTLRHRLVTATASVCGEAGGNRAELGETAACRSAALKGAIADLSRVVASARSQDPVTLAAAH